MTQEQVKIFESPQFGQIRTAGTSEEPLFCLSDVAKALDYSNPAKAVIDHCKGVTILETPTNGGIQNIKFGKESEVYRLIMKSKTNRAEAFQDWVCGEVLPSIRKTGSYSLSVPSYQIEDPIDRAKKWIEEQECSQKALAQANAVINEQKPLVTFANSILGSKDSCLVRDLAKLFTQNGIKIGQKTMFYVLKRDGYICGGKHSGNMPTQRAVEMGIMEMKETTIFDKEGNSHIRRTPKITQKGCQFLFDKYTKIYNERNQIMQ